MIPAFFSEKRIDRIVQKIAEKIQDKYKILVRNAGQDFMPHPGTFETEKEAIEKAKTIADKDLTDKKPITDKDREDSLPARERIRQILKGK